MEREWEERGRERRRGAPIDMSGCVRSASLATPPATPLEPHLAFINRVLGSGLCTAQFLLACAAISACHLSPRAARALPPSPPLRARTGPFRVDSQSQFFDQARRPTASARPHALRSVWGLRLAHARSVLTRRSRRPARLIEKLALRVDARGAPASAARLGDERTSSPRTQMARRNCSAGESELCRAQPRAEHAIYESQVRLKGGRGGHGKRSAAHGTRHVYGRPFPFPSLPRPSSFPNLLLSLPSSFPSLPSPCH